MASVHPGTVRGEITASQQSAPSCKKAHIVENFPFRAEWRNRCMSGNLSLQRPGTEAELSIGLSVESRSLTVALS